MTDSAAAALYDFFGRQTEKAFAPHRRELLTHARGRVLEIGAGTGFNLEHYPAGVDEIVFTEPSPAMLRRAEGRAAALGGRAQGVQTPAERLPFERASFDTVVSTLVLCSVGDQDDALAEIRRVLTPDGRFLFIEHVRSDDERLARWQDRLERPWGVVSFGCHPNRATLDRIEAAGFAVEALESGALPNAPRLVRPMITGRAVAL